MAVFTVQYHGESQIVDEVTGPQAVHGGPLLRQVGGSETVHSGPWQDSSSPVRRRTEVSPD